MKQPNTLLKLAAIVSSVLLVGGFVAYRAGAFDWLTQDSSPPSNPAPDGRIMSGSKFSTMFFPDASQQATPATQRPTILMPGSKSAAISSSVPTLTPKPSETPPQQSP